MHYSYTTRGTCSQIIDFEIDDGVISSVRFTGGCNGNLKGVSRLVEGMRAEDIAAKLGGIRCGLKPTSCPDQLARAVSEALAAEGSARA